MRRRNGRRKIFTKERMLRVAMTRLITAMRMMTAMRLMTATLLTTSILLVVPMPLVASAAEANLPEGFVDPASAMNLRSSGINAFTENWERIEALYLVPYVAHTQVFDSHLSRAEDRLFYPVSGAPLLLMRGEIVPDYRLDISYGPIRYDLAGDITEAVVAGEYVMKNIQFGTTDSQDILHNAGGSFTVSDVTVGSGSDPYVVQYELAESVDYGSKNRLPEASYAADAVVDKDHPDMVLIKAYGNSVNRDGDSNKVMQVHFRLAGIQLSGTAAQGDSADKMGGDEKDASPSGIFGQDKEKPSSGTSENNKEKPSSGIFGTDQDSSRDATTDDVAGPLTTLVISVIAILLSILFGNAGGMSHGAPAGSGSTPPPPAKSGTAPAGLNRWMRMDEDGDLEATDPVNGQKRTFVHNGDGTYTDPVSGATYTPEELSGQLAHREAHAGTIRQDEAQFRQNAGEDAQRNQVRSEEGRQLEEELRQERQARTREEKIERIATDLGMSGASEEDVRQELIRRMERDEGFRQKMNDFAKRRDTAVDVLETTVEAVDYGMSIGEAVVPGGAAVSATYKGIKNIGSTVAEKGASVGSVIEGAIKGGTEAAGTVMKPGIGKAVTTFGGTVAGEVAEAVNDGGDLTRATLEGFVKGTVGAASGAAGDAFGDAVKGDGLLNKAAEAAGKVGETGFGKEVAEPATDKIIHPET